MKTMKINFSKNANGNGNKKKGVKRAHFLKGFAPVWNEDESEIEYFDALFETTTKSKKYKDQNNSVYSMISVEEMEAILERLSIADYESECEERNGTYMFVDDEGELCKVPQTKLFGIEIDGCVLSRSCQLGVFSHIFAGLEVGRGIYERTGENAGEFCSNRELLNVGGVRCLYAFDKNGELQLQPIYVELSCNFTDELIDGVLVTNTTTKECLEDWNDNTDDGLVYKYAKEGYINPETLLELYEENKIHAKHLIKAIEGDANGKGIVSFDYNEYDFLAAWNDETTEIADDEDEDESEDNTALINQIKSQSSKTELKKLAKEQGLTLAFKTSHTAAKMQEMIIEALNA